MQVIDTFEYKPVKKNTVKKTVNNSTKKNSPVYESSKAGIKDVFEYRQNKEKELVKYGNLEFASCKKNDIKSVCKNNVIYHTTDTNEFFFCWNNKIYGLSLFDDTIISPDELDNELVEYLEKKEFQAEIKKIKDGITNNQAEVNKNYVKKEELSAAVKLRKGDIGYLVDEDLIYIPNENFNEGLQMNKEHGGLGQHNVKYFRDNQKTFSQMFDDILFPTLQPTKTDPSITLTYNGKKVIEVGEKLPGKSAFSVTTNRGNLEYGNTSGDNYYAGEPGEVTLTMTDNAFDTESNAKKYRVTASVTFANGAKPLDNKGGESTVDAYSSSTKTASVDIEAVYKVYVNNNNIKVMDILGGEVNNKGEYYVTIPAEADGTLDKFKLEVPEGYGFTISKKNNVSGKYDINVNLVDNGTVTYQDAAGKNVEYKKYIRTLKTSGDTIGESQYKITITRE